MTTRSAMNPPPVPKRLEFPLRMQRTPVEVCGSHGRFALAIGLTTCLCLFTGAAPFQTVTGSISFGSSAVDYTTTTSHATRRPDAVFEGKRQVNVQKTSFQLGDDAVDFVSSRMADEGLASRPKQTRFKPELSDDSTSRATAALLGGKRDATPGPMSSFSMGSAQWEPQSSSSSSFQWPDTSDPANRRGKASISAHDCGHVCGV